MSDKTIVTESSIGGLRYVRNDFARHCNFDASGRTANLAAQPSVGVLPERWAWPDLFDSAYSRSIGQSLRSILTLNSELYKNQIHLQEKETFIMVNLSRITKIMVCFVLVASFMGNAHAASQHEASTGQIIDDSVITTRVKAAIFEESSLKSLQINVKTFQGTVQLSGFVDSAHSVTKAGEIARNTKNVISVTNDLIVK